MGHSKPGYYGLRIILAIFIGFAIFLIAEAVMFESANYALFVILAIVGIVITVYLMKH